MRSSNLVKALESFQTAREALRKLSCLESEWLSTIDLRSAQAALRQTFSFPEVVKQDESLKQQQKRGHLEKALRFCEAGYERA